MARPISPLRRIPDVAKELDVPPGSLRNAAEEHGFLVRVGRAIRIDSDTLPELIERCRDKPKAPASSSAPTASGTFRDTGGKIRHNEALETAAKLKERSRSTSPPSTDRPGKLHRIK